MPTRNEVLIRSANLLNDFAFKYVFGEDCKEANDALKSLLTVFLERSVNKVVVKNSEMVKDYSKMKSPRLDLLVEFDEPDSGEILFEGEDISKTGYTNHRKNHICLVFQNYNLIDYLTPLENVRLVNSKASPSILLDLGLEQSQINRSVMKLSGGQQQRVAIARALTSSAPIILADEPTGNLDSDTASEIIDILKARAKERNKCVIVVTHSKEVADAADVVYELKDKKLKKRGK